MIYLVIENFRGGDPRPVYARFAERGRLAPEGLRYVSSWVTQDLRRCYQVMEAGDRALLDTWIDRWRDLVDFEVIPVVTSAEAAAMVAALAGAPAASPPPAARTT
jgi:hypothetical protein